MLVNRYRFEELQAVPFAARLCQKLGFNPGAIDPLRTRLSICLRKARFRTQDEALAAAERSGWELRTYLCDRCRLYHLTSRTKGKRIPRPEA